MRGAALTAARQGGVFCRERMAHSSGVEMRIVSDPRVGEEFRRTLDAWLTPFSLMCRRAHCTDVRSVL